MWIKVHEGKIVNLENGTVIKQVMQFNGEDSGFYYILLNNEVIADFGDDSMQTVILTSWQKNSVRRRFKWKRKNLQSICRKCNNYAKIYISLNIFILHK